MALRTVSNTGGNWSATAAWTGGVVPLTGDTVNFTATSGNLTVDVNTNTLTGIDFSNYVNTITFNFNILSSGTINLGTGGFTIAGTQALVINGTSTISGTTSWSGNITFTGTSLTHTLSNNITVTGSIAINPTTAVTFSGTGGFSAGTLILVGTGITMTLKNGVTYTVTDSFTNNTVTPATAASPYTITSDSGTIQTKLTLSDGATQDLRFVNATRVDSSLGRTVYSYRGTLTSTTNWSLLPVDPSSQKSQTFIK